MLRIRRPAILTEIFSWCYSVLPDECLELGHDHFFQIPFNSSFTYRPIIRRCIVWVTEKASLITLQMNHTLFWKIIGGWCTDPPNSYFSLLISAECKAAFDFKMTVFWDIAPCNLVEVDRRFRGAYWLHHHLPDDGGSTHLWNVGLLLDYTALYPRRLSSLYPLPWEPEIAQFLVVPC
jgi:hypothetical protein